MGRMKKIELRKGPCVLVGGMLRQVSSVSRLKEIRRERRVLERGRRPKKFRILTSLFWWMPGRCKVVTISSRSYPSVKKLFEISAFSIDAVAKVKQT